MIWKLLRLPFVPLALLCVAFMRLARPWWHIRVGVLMSKRIGHLSGNTEVYLCERDAGIHKTTDIWTAWGGVCNKYLMKMIGRSIHIDPTRFTLLVILCNKLFQGWDKHDISAGTYDRDPDNLLEKSKPHYHFTAREEIEGEEGLRRMGIPLNAKFVCLMVRDAAYLPTLEYHNYRDSDIDSYGPAAMSLAARGYYVIRMGAKVEKPFRVQHPRIIDYATNGMRSEFMDIYLGAKCTFCISNGTGWDSIAEVFRRRICFVNQVPLEYLRTYIPGSLAIWKHHYKDGKRMTLEEIYKSPVGSALHAPVFEMNGVELVDNTPEEIVEVALQMADECEGCVYESDQSAFWEKFPRSMSIYNNKPLHGNIRMRIGREFLKQYA